MKSLIISILIALISIGNIHAEAYKWRGCMIDLSRHYFPTSFLKKQIDILSSIGINTLHLHLTDAGGWRIEIKKYPRLTSYAAWRTQSDWELWWNQNDRTYVEEGTPNAYGGYYTQNELKQLVAYAKEKNVTIVPEIEMPGHSEEIFATYPQLRCEGNKGAQSDYCPSNPKTYQFLYNIIDEVLDIFPSEYIHLGGDEAGMQSWKKCSRCKKMQQKYLLTKTEQLQDVFMRHMTKYIASKGRRPIVWDEALTDSLAPNTIIMVWRNANTAKEAIKKGYDVVLSPTSHCYLDYYQDAPPTQPKALGGFLPFDTVYSFKPLKGILGIQGNLWTEFVPTTAHAEYMLYPRMLAIAEIALHPDNKLPLRKIRKKAILFTDSLRKHNINAFNLRKEIGQRKEYRKPIKHKALKAKVTYNHPYSPYYTAAKEMTLTDGLQGSWQHGDNRWQGFIGENALDITIDLGKEKNIKEIYASFMQSDGAWIYFPKDFTISVADEKMNFHTIYKQYSPKKHLERTEYKKIGWKGKKTKMRYIHIIGNPVGRPYWIFADEIIIR